MKYKVLVLVDIQNVYFGAKNYTDGNHKIDYIALMRHIKVSMEQYYIANLPEVESQYLELEMDYKGYVVQTPRYNGTAFFAFLRKIGYSLRMQPYSGRGIDIYEDEEDTEHEWKGSVGPLMQMDFLDWGPDYNAVVVVSGSGVFQKVFQAVKVNWPHIVCAISAFDNILHDVYTKRDDLVDHIIYLNSNVLRDVADAP